MSTPDPDLVLLLRGELLALSPLDYARLRARMLSKLTDALHARQRGSGSSSRSPEYNILRDPRDPGVALVEALAACLDVMGFYHDRILTESKLGAALRLESIARLGASVGYRPAPAVAATSLQFFEALAAGLVLEGTRVGGPGAVFATRATVSIAPEYNRMRLSPQLTRQTGAVRAALERMSTASLPEALKHEPFTSVAAHLDATFISLPFHEFRAGVMALINGAQGLELCPTTHGRRAGVGFGRPLLRSHDEESTTLSRTTRARHLRFGHPLHDAPAPGDPAQAPLMIFEVCREPVLPRPETPAAEPPGSTLEVFVFDKTGDVPPPDEWDPKDAWTEVADFTASEATDRHYRTFVDDRLTTHVILRRALGYRILLDDHALSRVYARYVPAIGRAADTSTERPSLDGVTLELDRGYFETALVRPAFEGVPFTNEGGWAVTQGEMGLSAGHQIAILGAPSGEVFFRALDFTRTRYLRWTKPDQSDPPYITEVFDVAKARIAPIEDVASGQPYPLWDAFYKQPRPRNAGWVASPVPGTEIPTNLITAEIPPSSSGSPAIPIGRVNGHVAVEQRICLLKGTTFLLLEDTSHVKSGDYLLVGRRLKESVRMVSSPVPPGDRTGFNVNEPWLNAEVVQAVEVQGNLVRLKDAIGQDFHVDRVTPPATASEEDYDDYEVTELMVVPKVASVYYGDKFTQDVPLTKDRTFVQLDPSISTYYTRAAITPTFPDPNRLDRDPQGTPRISAPMLRERLGIRDFADFARLFVAVAGRVQEVAGARWSFFMTVPSRGLETGAVRGLVLASTGEELHHPGPVVTPDGASLGITLKDVQAASSARQNRANLRVTVNLDAPTLGWTQAPDPSAPLAIGQFRATSRGGWRFLPGTGASPALDEALLSGGGELFVHPNQRIAWSAWSGPLPSGGIPLVSGPSSTGPLTVVAIAVNRRLGVPPSSVLAWRADWRVAPWDTNGRAGVLVLEGGGSFREFEFSRTVGTSGIDLLDTPVHGDNPLADVTRLWALAAGGPATATEWGARWRFNATMPGDSGWVARWDHKIAVMSPPSGPSRVLSEVSVDSRGFYKDQPVTTPAPDAGWSEIHALYRTAIEPGALKTFWFIGTRDGAVGGSAWISQFDIRDRIALETPGGVKIAEASWWDQTSGQLRLRADPHFSPGTDGEFRVTRLVDYEYDPVSGVTITGTSSTTVEFNLPASWRPNDPSLSPAAALLCRNPGGGFSILFADSEPVSGATAGRWRLSFNTDIRSFIAQGADQEIHAAYRRSNLTNSSIQGRRVYGLEFSPTEVSQWRTPAPPQLVFETQNALKALDVQITEAALSTVRILPVHPENQLFPTDFTHAYLSLFSLHGVTPGLVSFVKFPPAAVPPPGDGTIRSLVRAAGSSWSQFEVASRVTQEFELASLPGNVFPPGTTPTFRFAFLVRAPTGLSSSLLRVRAEVQPPPTGPAVSDLVNAAVLHNDGSGAPLVFLSRRAGSRIWEVDEVRSFNDLFTPSGVPGYAHFSFAQRWTNLPRESFQNAPATLELAPLPGITLGESDTLAVTLAGSTSPIVVTIRSVGTSGVYALAGSLDPQAAITAIHLDGLFVTDPPLGPSAEVAIPEPTPSQSPWLLTFNPRGATIYATLLSHVASPRHVGGSIAFAFASVGPMDEIINRNLAGQPLYYYTNEVGQLRDDLYTRLVPGFDGNTQNFFDPQNQGLISELMTKVAAPNFPQDGNARGPAVLLATDGSPPTESSLVEFSSGARTQGQVRVPVLSQSILFGSGDFIPVLGAFSNRDEEIIRAALRVFVPLRNSVLPHVVTYNPGVGRIVEEIEQGAYHFIEPKYLYSFNKVPGGAFTLNFLLISNDLPDDCHATVYVEYAARRAHPEQTESRPTDPLYLKDPIYEFETRVQILNPQRQLVVLDSTRLKPGDYLFLHDRGLPTTLRNSRPLSPIQWTRIDSVKGAVIDVSPAVDFDVADFHHYALHGFFKPPHPMQLDKDYYAALKDAELRSDRRVLPLRDRLVFDRDRAVNAEILDTLVPGDRLLIWNEDRRRAWQDHRVPPSPQSTAGGPSWTEWPDHQHEAVIKSLDRATGLVVLTEPLPDRFFVRFDDPANTGGRLRLSTAPSLRVLPHHRAAFQGRRRWVELGSGDKGRRFARYTAELDHDPGLATTPGPSEKTYASNIEVFAKDAKGEWSRWTQFASIDDAEKKDRAFVLGVDPAQLGRPSARVPFSVSFGDGTRGETLPNGDRNVFARSTDVGGFSRHAPALWPLRILDWGIGPPPFEVAPETGTRPENLWLLVETSAPWHWSTLRGAGRWESSLGVRVGSREPRELSEGEARAGFDGFYVHPVRPGVVQVFFCGRTAILYSGVQLWEALDAGVWLPARGFYQDPALRDVTRAVGASRVQLLETAGLKPGAILAFVRADKAGVETVKVKSVDHDTWSVELDRPLANTYSQEESFIRGNLVEVAQGDVTEVTLGGSDGVTADLRLAVYNRAPLLHVAREDGDLEPAIEVRVDGNLWRRVDDFSSSQPRDRVWKLDLEADGGAFAVFGDGVRGAVPPSGNDNISATIRTGDGAAANLPAESVDKLRDGNLAVKRTRNITGASGGRRAADVSQARAELSRIVASPDRIVSREDVVWAARELGEVLHARLDPTAPAGTLCLVVALANRRPLSGEMQVQLGESIRARLPATSDFAVEVRGAAQVPAYVEVEVSVVAGHAPGDVLMALVEAFSPTEGRFFDAARWPVGEPLRLGDLYEAVAHVRGVEAARIVRLSATENGPNVESLDPGPSGVIRCDSDAVNDPGRRRGVIAFELKPGGA